MWMTEFADDGVLKLFDCLEIVGMDVSIEVTPKEVQLELISGESRTWSAGFSS